eukprot:symbB.v1.2.002128.t1/scaffold106.1/size366728/16
MLEAGEASREAFAHHLQGIFQHAAATHFSSQRCIDEDSMPREDSCAADGIDAAQNKCDMSRARDLGMCFPFVRHMRDQFKMNVLAVEYPGYGLLHGISRSSEAALKEVTLTAFRFILDELKVAYEQIILFGRSVGSGPTVYLASRFPVGGLILVAAFASVREAAKSLVGPFVANVLEERFPNIALIGNVSCPTLFIHGEKDSLVPPSHSVALFKQCRARKLLITPPGMEHNTNLFTDAQYLAVPAINFFGLPGYQQESPPQMPSRYFEDGRQAFLLRKASRRGSDDAQSPWFYFCGCPTSHAADKPQCEWEPNERAGGVSEDQANSARKSELGHWPDSPRERWKEAQEFREEEIDETDDN